MPVKMYVVERRDDTLFKKPIEKLDRKEADKIIKENGTIVKEKIYGRSLKVRYTITYLKGFLLFVREYLHGSTYLKTEYPLLKTGKAKAKEIMMYFINNAKTNFEDLSEKFGIELSIGEFFNDKKVEENIIKQYPKSLLESIKEKQRFIREGKRKKVFWTKKEREFLTRLVNDRLKRGVCIFCGENLIVRDGNHHRGGQAYMCLKCGRRFKENSKYIKFSLISF